MFTPGNKRGENYAILRGDLMAVLDLAAGRRGIRRPESYNKRGPGTPRKSYGSRSYARGWEWPSVLTAFGTRRSLELRNVARQKLVTGPLVLNNLVFRED